MADDYVIKGRMTNNRSTANIVVMKDDNVVMNICTKSISHIAMILFLKRKKTLDLLKE